MLSTLKTSSHFTYTPFFLPVRVILILSIFATCAPLAKAEYISGPFDYSEDFSLFGQQANTSCTVKAGGTTAICGAVAAVNSFIFLENKYSDVYGNSLTPNLTGNTDPTDAKNFAVDGFGTYTGYYNRTGTAGGDYIDTLTDWFDLYAPGTTLLSSWYSGSSQNDYLPGISDMAYEIRESEDVELFAKMGDVYHVLTLTGITCDAVGNCSMTYQDPNSPATPQSAALTLVDGSLQFSDLPGSGYTGTFSITGMFAESPIPEPSTLLLVGGGLLGLLVAGQRSGSRAHGRERAVG